jgi:CRISPR-associated endonuclease/helicase Cas3
MIKFDQLFVLLHDVRPLPWQRELATMLGDLPADGKAPDLDIPTGLGKTVGISTAWLWALAADVESNGITERRTPIRLVHVAPRRAIVDDAFRSNSQIAKKLLNATTGPLAEVAVLLRSLSNLPGHQGEPLAVANLQGGCPPDLDWRGRADVPTVILSTEEQAVSGLLFRSYISSSSTKPMVAGLLGVDAGWVMDESHLMEPSVHAIDWCLSRQAELAGGRIPDRHWIIRSSATRGSIGRRSVRLTAADRSNAVVSRRIGAEKTIIPRSALPRRAEPGRDREALVRTAFLNSSQELLDAGAEKLMVICHTVDRARDVHRGLRCAFKDELLRDNIDIELLHGQQRRAEREQIMDRVRRAMATGANRPPHPFVLVSTSVIEVGADLDADAMVCEQAPWPNLQQRLGRLGREGRPGTCILLGTPLAPSEPGDEETEEATPYSSAAAKTFAALKSACEGGTFSWKIGEKAPAGVEALPSPSPWPLVDETISWLALTGPLGRVTVDPAQIMAGVARRSIPEVGLVWRDHLESSSSIAEARSCLATYPVLPHEVVTAPISAVQKGLKGLSAKELSTIVLRRSDGELCPLVDSRLRVGDLVLLPPTVGRYTSWGLDWTSAERVPDVSDVLQRAGRKGPRVHFRLSDAQQAELDDLVEGGLELAIALSQVLRVLPDDLSWINWSEANVSLIAKEWVFVSSGWDQRLDEAASCGRRADVSLIDHQADVAELAQQLAQGLGVKGQDLDSLVTGAAHHDEGKRDQRIQHAYGQRGSSPLGKSVTSPGRYRREIAEQVMAGWRHEAVSDRLVSHSGDILASHLAGCTHGWSRPCYRILAVRDTDVTVSCPYCLPSGGIWTHNPTFSGDVHSQVGERPARFARLNHDYGPWGLAWMETLVRQSDWMASAAPRKDVPLPAHRPVRHATPGLLYRPRCADAPFPVGWSVAGLLAAYGTLFVYSETHPEATLRFDARMPILSGPLNTADLRSLVDSYRGEVRGRLAGVEHPLISEGFASVAEYETSEYERVQPLNDRLARLIVAQTTVSDTKVRLHRLALPISLCATPPVRRTLQTQLSGLDESRGDGSRVWGWDAEANYRSSADLPAEEWHWLSFVGALLVPCPYSSSPIALAIWDEARDINAVIASLANPGATSTPVPLRSYRRVRGRDGYVGWAIAA